MIVHISHQPLDGRVVLPDAGRQDGRTPLSPHTGGSLRSAQLQPVALVTVEYDLPVVGDLLDVGPVVVEAHVAHQEYLAVLEEAREGAVHLLTAGSEAGPVPVVAVSAGSSIQLVAVLAVVEAGGPVTQ